MMMLMTHSNTTAYKQLYKSLPIIANIHQKDLREYQQNCHNLCMINESFWFYISQETAQHWS